MAVCGGHTDRRGTEMNKHTVAGVVVLAAAPSPPPATAESPVSGLTSKQLKIRRLGQGN